MTGAEPGLPPPALGSADVYVHALANGAVFLLDATGRGGLVPLGTALAAGEGAAAAGGRVLLGQDDTDLARDAVEVLRRHGLPLVDQPGAPAPQTWEHGTDALMEAAANGSDELLDDLLARGADPHQVDDSGASALHHAAAHGNLHALDALAAAGADLDRANRDGLTPLAIARATRQDAAIERLVELGAGIGTGLDPAGTAPITFRRTHLGAVWFFVLLPIPMLVTAVVGLWPLSAVDGIVVALVAGAYLWLAPPRPYWTGGVPRGLAGDRLLLRTVTGGSRTVDLADVTAAALCGTGQARAYGGRVVLLAHRDGTPATPHQLRRLGMAADEAAMVADRFDRVIAVPLSGAHRDEVVLALGNRLSALGVDLSAGFRRQLAAARRPR